MRPFAYIRPATLDEAMREAADAGTRFIAGGTNIIDLMRSGIESPDKLVDISRLPLGEIEKAGDGLRIGALVSNSDMAAAPQIRTHWPMLSEAILAGASAQLRNRATTGGNLMQRPRCAYFYDLSMDCNKRLPGSGCSAMCGKNRMHAILGASSSCIAVHPSDMAVAAMALGAEVEIEAPGRQKRSVPIAQLYRLPDDSTDRETTLEPGELITALKLPAPIGGAQCYRKVRDRASFAFALVSLAAALDVRDGRIAEVRLAIGGVAPMPWRRIDAEALLIGEKPAHAVFERAADVILAGASGYGDNAFKIPLARSAIVGTLLELAKITDD